MPVDDGTGENLSIVHATCVAVENNGLLIMGASGSGKSSLALSLMAMGATLVADDRVILSLTDGRLIASVPPVLEGMIEARGVGVIRCKANGPVPIKSVVDMDQSEEERLPDARTITVLGQPVPLLHRVDGDHFAPALMQMLKFGRHDN